MLTTTVDGLWALQVLTGIEVLAPELALRPVLPSVETRDVACAHPICAGLRSAGVIDEGGTVDPTVVEWLTVLARRDVALVIELRHPGHDPPARAMLARFARWWVVAERSEDRIRIGGAGTAAGEHDANHIVAEWIQYQCGDLDPAPLRPVTLNAADLNAHAGRESLRAYLLAQRIDADQLQILTMAADPRRCAQASIVAIQSGLESGRSSRTLVEHTVVSIIDTPAGRLVAEHVPTRGNDWLILAPGTPGHIARAVTHLLRRLPAEDQWHCHRRVV